MSGKNFSCGSQTIQLDEFNMRNLIYKSDGSSCNPRIAIIAKSGSGKSVVIKDIMYHMHKSGVPCGTVIAPTDKMNRFYQDFVPESFIHHEYDGSIIQKFMNRQLKMIEENNKREKNKKKLTDPRAYLIMDDCMSTKHLWLKDPLILSIFNEGRHYQIAPFILSLQYSIGIQPELRNNFDYVFLLGEDTFSSRQKLHQHYAGIFKKYDFFEDVFSQVTDDYGCMVLDNRLRSSDIRKKVFWYKANNHLPKFTIGSKKVLKFDKENLDKDYGKNNKMDVVDLCTNRKTVVKVDKIPKGVVK